MPKILMLSLALLQISCASIINESTDRVLVTTIPKGAKIESDDNTCISPCHLTLRRGRSYVLKISKENYKTKEIYLDGRSWDAAMWGNVLIGGFIGLGIDMASEKGYDFEPENVSTALQKEENLPEQKRKLASEN